jgi:hypothetical protein
LGFADPSGGSSDDITRAIGHRTQAVWIKDQIRKGYWFRNQHEVLQHPLIEPDMQICRIRLSEKRHAFVHGA